jgi:hypothetical protein
MSKQRIQRRCLPESTGMTVAGGDIAPFTRSMIVAFTFISAPEESRTR